MVGVNFRSRHELVRARPKIPLYAKIQPCWYRCFLNQFWTYYQKYIYKYSPEQSGPCMGRWIMDHGQSIKRSSFFGARSRSALLIRKKSGAPVFAPPIKKERALAPAPQKLERAHFALLHFLCIKMC